MSFSALETRLARMEVRRSELKPAEVGSKMQPWVAELHRRQFLLGPVPFRREGWLSRELTNGLVLSHCASLEVQTSVDGNGQEWTLLGFAAQTEHDRPDPIDALCGTTDDVSNVTRTWTGRWILIGGDELRLDASGLLGCFYRTIESGPNSGLWMSSSVALLAGLPGSPSAGSPQGEFGWAVGVDWFPPPQSRYPGIRSVLASQILKLNAGSVRTIRKSVPHPLQQNRSSDELAAVVERRLVTGIQNIARTSNGPLWIALTAGGDSRLVLAAAHAAGIEVRTFTHELPFHRWGHGLADRNLPPALAQEIGTEHALIEARARSDALVELWDTHTAGQSAEADRDLLARGQWDAIPAESTVIRAGLFEMAQNSEHDYLPPVDRDPALMMKALDAYASHFGRALTDYQRIGLSEWVDWMLADPEPRIDWRDRFFHEQRVAGWLSSIEQGLDSTGRRSVQLANCTALIEELMTFDHDMRTMVEHHLLLIERMAPELLSHPVNPDDGWLVRIAGKVVREVYRMTNPGEGSYLENVGQRLRSKLGRPAPRGRTAVADLAPTDISISSRSRLEHRQDGSSSSSWTSDDAADG